MQQLAKSEKHIYTIKTLGNTLNLKGLTGLAVATYDFAKNNNCCIIKSSKQIADNIYRLSSNEIIQLKYFISSNIKYRKYKNYCIRSKTPSYKKFILFINTIGLNFQEYINGFMSLLLN